MAAFCRAWAPATYDAVFYLTGAYTDPADPMRSKVTQLQDQTATAVRTACTEAGLSPHDVPAGLHVPERVAHLARRVDTLLTAASR